MKTVFKEQQMFNQWWLWLILLGLLGFSCWNLLAQPVMNSSNIVFAVITSTIVLLFAMMKLITTINTEGIQIKFIPFVRKYVKWGEVKSAEVVDYGFVGGWGIRLWTDYGTVYNTSGTKGLKVEMKDGKHFLVGTQKEEELMEVISELKDEQ